MALLEVDTPAQLQQLLSKEAEAGGAVLAKAFKVFVAKPGAPAGPAPVAAPGAGARGSTAGTRSSTGGMPADGAAAFAALVQEAQGSGLFQVGQGARRGKVHGNEGRMLQTMEGFMRCQRTPPHASTPTYSLAYTPTLVPSLF
jgi:hypothetical protein